MTKVRDLAARVERLTEEEALRLPGEDYSKVQAIWVRLHFTSEEHAEYCDLNEHDNALYENYLGDNWTPEMQLKSTRIGRRMLEIDHDTVLQRSIRNRPLRVKVWPELAPRVLRLCKLTAKPEEQLSFQEKEELDDIVEYFNELQKRALGEDWKH